MLRFPLLLLACLTLASCFLKPYKIDVMQGNYIDDQLVSKLKRDMTRSQVRFLMGTPLIADSFHPDRWDYLYIDRRAGKLKEVRRLTLYFEDDKLKRALTDLPVDLAKSQAAAVTPALADVKPPASPEPAASAQPAPLGEPLPPGQPAASDEPLPSTGPAASDEPVPPKQPATSGGPVPPKQPATSSEPGPPTQPAASGEPASPAQPAAKGPPAASGPATYPVNRQGRL